MNKMIKRALAGVVATAGLGAVLFVAPARADGPPPHAHLHFNGVVIDEDENGEESISIKGCRFLAAGRAVPTHAHHDNLHTGLAGEALWNAGNAVVPVFFPDENGEGGTPWQNCEDFIEFLGITVRKGR
jgi:hypothetical protein